MKFIGRMAVAGGESGIVGVISAAFPILFLGSAFMGDAAILVMLLGHGLLLGFYLARKLTRDAGFTPEQARILRFAPGLIGAGEVQIPRMAARPNWHAMTAVPGIG